ncbi:PfkB family carbohydrate kinase [Bradyrhizobium sp.]|uniref:PfkB family carbohydrate kinase n=1 Tax=Bradyrhizobium sp. TaxID=376 RepID=UPI000A81F4BA|nr:PfkB family carbohydrate kinase [Bradyrhizobium sp.]
MSGHSFSETGDSRTTSLDLAARASSTRVICLGLSALDQIWRVPKFFSGGSQKIRSLHYGTMGGGMAATAAVTVARLGGQAAFWGRGGEDVAGLEMRTALAGHGVDVAQFRLFVDGHSSVSGVLVDSSGERQIVNFRGQFPDEADWLPLGDVGAAAAVLADPRWPAGAVALFKAARAKAVPTVLDADVADPDVFEALLPLTDHAIFSEPALAGFTGSSGDAALPAIARFGCAVAAVTRGADGVTWLQNDIARRQPAYAVNVVDTTGAGDVFHGAYAFAIGAGLVAADAMSFAAAAAALKCTRPGGRAGIPTLEDCLEFQRNGS